MKIIILDDSLTVRMTVEALLEDLGVHEEEVFSFEEGAEALMHIEEHGAELVFTDMHMPGLSGYDFVKRLLHVRPELSSSLFVISGEEEKGAVFKMKEVGAYRFMKKPLNLEYFKHFVLPEIARIRVKEKQNG